MVATGETPAKNRVVIAEWFAAPAGLGMVRLPLTLPGGIPPDAGIGVVLLSAAGEWRRAEVAASEAPAMVQLDFAGLGDGRGVALLVTCGARWQAPSQMRCRWMWRRVRRRPPIVVAALGIAPLGGGQGGAHTMRLIDAGVGTGADGLAEFARPVTAAMAIDRFWRDGGGCYVEGWLHAGAWRVAHAAFMQDHGPRVEVTAFHARPDLMAHYPMLPDGGERAGFVAFLPKQSGPQLELVVATSDGATARAWARLTGMEADGTFAWGDPGAESARAAAAWQQFRGEMVERRLEVLEIGARVVAMSSVDLRASFAGAGRYAGIDIHAAPGLDFVGDAHSLSDVVGLRCFDGVFSSAVMEHLAMPWVAAAEMNRALRMGGLVFHRTHQCWPVHERPNDFFRFSDEALRVLFGAGFGFEVIDAGMAAPMAIHPRQRHDMQMNQIALNPGFGMAWVLARKVSEVGEGRLGGGEVLSALSVRYPRPAAAGAGREQ